MWAPLSVCCVCNIDGLVDKTLMDYTIIARNTRPRESRGASLQFQSANIRISRDNDIHTNAAILYHMIELEKYQNFIKLSFFLSLSKLRNETNQSIVLTCNISGNSHQIWFSTRLRLPPLVDQGKTKLDKHISIILWRSIRYIDWVGDPSTFRHFSNCQAGIVRPARRIPTTINNV